ncbi:NrfD/PsrC family molybdoenzyme membrane anchor subunit [Thermodesulfobacteriota bacterium]
MADYQTNTNPEGGWIKEKLLMGLSPGEYIGKLFTPFNFMAAIIISVGAVIAVIRFTKGLGAIGVTSNTYPWGLFIGLNMICGVALSAGGFMLAAALHLFGLKEYKPLVRLAILIGLLGYFFAVWGLLVDLGRPWRLPYPMFVSLGVMSVLFLVAWHVALYLSVQFVEFSPALFEWLGWKGLRRWIEKIMAGACIAGVILSMLHQSALGALFLMAPGKLHPLWYSPLIPLFFFVSAMAGGLAMVLFAGVLVPRCFKNQVDAGSAAKLDELFLGLGKAISLILFTYFGLKLVGVAHSASWHLLSTSFGLLFCIEMLVFVLMPCIILLLGYRQRSVGTIWFGSMITIAGIIFNRLTVTLVAYNWNIPERFSPHWMEVWLSITIITIGVVTYRWVMNRMPVLYEHPDY